jgi:hypothetical protein
MARRSFSIDTSEDPNTLVDRARRLAAQNNALLEGDASSGRFSGRGIEGIYDIEGTTVTVTITDKPFFLPWEYVESRVREFFR